MNLAEYFDKEGSYIFDFVGLQYDFCLMDLSDIVKSILKPKVIVKTDLGWSSADGYFIKDHILVEMHEDQMLGLWLSCPKDTPPKSVEKVRIWAKVVFDHMVEIDYQKKP